MNVTLNGQTAKIVDQKAGWFTVEVAGQTKKVRRAALAFEAEPHPSLESTPAPTKEQA